jgi:hypothetical protein
VRDGSEASFSSILRCPSSVRLDILRANIWIHCRNGSVCRINILDKILVLGNISIGFVIVESKREHVIYRRPFGSRLIAYLIF